MASPAAATQNSFPSGLPIPGLITARARAARATDPASGTTFNANGGPTVLAAAAGPYDLSDEADRTISVSFSEDDGASYKTVTIEDIVGATPAATTAAEIAALLAANEVFNKFFTAANNAGALEITPRQSSALFKTYFAGTLAVVLDGDMVVAVDDASAITGSDEDGVTVTVLVEDADGNPVPGAHVFVSGVLAAGGALVGPAQLGLPTKGEGADAERGGITNVEFVTNIDGEVEFVFMDETAEAGKLNFVVTDADGAVNVALTGSLLLTSV